MQLSNPGQQSKLNPEQLKLIDEWRQGTVMKKDAPVFTYVLDADTGEVWMPIRDQIKVLGLDNNPDVIEIDKNLIKLSLQSPSIVQTWDNDQPTESWWWHLDKIVDHSYPSKLLPQYLQEIYLK